ncbi:TetR/AcrR family transcriptional regulator [Streptomyces sp. NPDC002896]|uniref:TetR/AcrR family transcriptional regulator n=1 Tax=Streptomyces sp. NPDC002896 TaxID=3154438 RepID=UPI00331B148A
MPLPAYQLERRRRIVSAAAAALDEQEYDQIQVRDVATRAGVALGTLYRYFGSKEHLYSAVLLDWISPEGGASAGRIRVVGTKSATERVRRRVHGTIAAFEQHPQYFKVLTLLTQTTDSQAQALYSEFSDMSYHGLSKELALLGPQQADDVTMMLWSTVTTMLTSAIYHGRSMRDVYRVCDGLIDLIEPQLMRAEAEDAAASVAG